MKFEEQGKGNENKYGSVIEWKSWANLYSYKKYGVKDLKQEILKDIL